MSSQKTSAPDGAHGNAFSGRVGWGSRPALLVIDLVRAYTEPDGPFALPEADAVVDATAALVAAARSGGHPVLWTTARYAPNMADGGLFARKVPALRAFAADADGGWGEQTLTPGPDDVIVVKQYASAFFGTSLASTLRTSGVDTLVIAGVSTSGCVRAGAMDALNHGIRPQVVRQACGDRTPELHENNLADLDAKYADVVDTAEALLHLGGPSTTPIPTPTSVEAGRKL
ncbi:isochorismatase family protein [Streptomyces sp. NPDC059893]|uniref:isochorismatase family protein n=1 Tax=Streptomyces sp. NPDC059893 TaxID=3346990 RepID=UPI003646BCBD